MFNLPFDSAVPINNQNKINLVCDRLNVDYEQWSTASMSISIFKNPTRISIVLPNSIAQNISEFEQYLQQSPITIQYQLATESVKTVDLTILDQNGQNVKHLMSFNGGTHFNTTCLEGSPLPVVSVSVETDLEEILMGCSLEGNTL